MTAVFVNWQDENRSWHTVAKLWRESGKYCFAYTKGASLAVGFQAFGSLNKIDTVYQSDDLFPMFANRILAKGRSEYESYLSWMSLSSSRADPLEILGRSGGYRATDGIQLYAEPSPSKEGKYETFFFVHGMRYTLVGTPGLTLNLSSGDRIFPMLDLCNEFDRNAVALRTSEPYAFIGYCPRYLAGDVGEMSKRLGKNLSICVSRVNAEAPLQMRVLCRVEAPWPEGFSPCSGVEYELVRGSS